MKYWWNIGRMGKMARVWIKMGVKLLSYSAYFKNGEIGLNRTRNEQLLVVIEQKLD